MLVALRRIVRFLRLAEREIETTCGLSVAQLFVLHQLFDAPASSIAEVAERTLTDPSSVSSVIARLVERKLVARQVAHTDRRRAELALTARGRRLALTAPRVPQATMLDAIRAMPPKRRATIARSLEALAGAIGANAVPPRMFFDDEPTGARARGGARPARRLAGARRSAPRARTPRER